MTDARDIRVRTTWEPEVNSLGVNLKAWDELVKDAPQSTFGQKSALKEQIGGEHYKNFEIQPIEFIHKKRIIVYSGQYYQNTFADINQKGD